MAFPLCLVPAEKPLLARRAMDEPEIDEPLLSVVIVNYCQWPETAALVRQLREALCLQQGAVEIVVVDNHSPPHPFAGRLRRLPGVSLRRWRRNRGFARAVNEGCRLSRAPWLLLLNPDVTITDGFLDEVLVLSERLSAQEPRTGVVGLHLRNADGSRQLSAGPYPTLGGTLSGLLLPRSRRKYHQRPALQRYPVSWATGCGLLIRDACLQEVGGFDEGFFLYYEDVDFCRRARQAGWSVCHEPALRLTHHRPLQIRAVSPYLRLLTRHALLTYAAKHWPRWQAGVLGHIVALEAGVRRAWARWRGDADAAETWTELAALAGDLRRGQAEEARRRLNQIVRQEEVRRGREPVPHHPQPQPGRPAARVSGQRIPARAG